jgi:hypothetical protein
MRYEHPADRLVLLSRWYHDALHGRPLGWRDCDDAICMGNRLAVDQASENGIVGKWRADLWREPDIDVSSESTFTKGDA